MAKELISDVIPSLRLTDNGQKALNWMEIFRISHLPVVDNHQYLGLISDKSIYDLNLNDKLMEDCRDFLVQPHVGVSQHIYEVVSVVSRLKITVVPVLDQEHQYRGVITVFDLAQRFADLVAVNEPGGVIVLELNPIDYSLAEIARIVEGNDAKILSLYVSKSDDSKEITVTLKINQMDLSPVIQTFVRFDYVIKSVFMDDSVLKHLYDDRFELLMKYLNI
ncbi:CBS domain-containing protein [Gaoshiqia sediminis]|uniref:CBS domain-containing protein n=1 Tax=Gaoshiqia sediminis TaxID=2986998 RepID=A0AA41Y936_9BACT|nr:CBS domain-containing protein [Gaoshiqia sediminis]MCW0484359.1 CBS domain-containing protein [Gaoshiqia sediminis]